VQQEEDAKRCERKPRLTAQSNTVTLSLTMKMHGNTILITGGSSGIGMALAERFLAKENTVIVCGRGEEALEKIKTRFPSLHVKVSDTGNPLDRADLAKWVVKKFPQLNFLINNAGIQRKFSFLKQEDWSATTSEIDINIGGPVHLSELLIPHLMKQKEAHIANVSSGLAFVPLANMPIYCATKAALHSITLSMRHQLKDTSIKVTEIIPPAVKTNLGGSHDFGVELGEFADAVMKQFAEGKQEITFGFSEQSSKLSRQGADEAFARMNNS
jgi:uncharacterized oxidoreductase